MNRFLLITGFLLIALSVSAQQDAQYSQYMFNGLVLNPAYAGSQDQGSLRLIGRRQWSGLNGAPATGSFSINGPFPNSLHSYGVTLVNDKIGATNNLGLTGAYAYRIQLDKGMLALGIQGELSNYRLDMSQLSPEDPSDIAFTGGNLNLYIPNIGTGVYFNNERFYAGASVPRLITNKLVPSGSLLDARRARHFMFTAGFFSRLSNSVGIKPSLLLKYTPNAPVSFDANLSFLFVDRLWAGISYRHRDAVVTMLQWNITNQFKVGYSYDFTTSELRSSNGGSHEIMLGFEFGAGKNKMVSPRHF